MAVTIHEVLDHLNKVSASQELNKDITARQEELKMNISSKHKLLKKVISAGNNKLEKDICACQRDLKSECPLQKIITVLLDRQFKGIMEVVKHETQNL
jgi:paraquat-inducible protein B